MSNETFNKRVYGCAIIKSLNANYNADFTKQPRTLPNGIVYATDKALKYTVRHFLYKNYSWNLDKGSDSVDKLLYFTRNKATIDSGKYVPMSLRELYVHLFGEMEKVTKEGKSPKWMFYYFDGEKVEGKLQKIKPSDIKKYYKELDDVPHYASNVERYISEAKDNLKLTKEGLIENISIDKESETEPFYFYIILKEITRL